jgi:hypothetical protein
MNYGKIIRGKIILDPNNFALNHSATSPIILELNHSDILLPKYRCQNHEGQNYC